MAVLKESEPSDREHPDGNKAAPTPTATLSQPTQEGLPGEFNIGELKSDMSSGPTRAEIWFHRVLAGALFLDASGANMVAPFFPAFSRLFGLGQRSIALLLGVRSVTSVLMIIPVGLCFRHFGHQAILTLSFLTAVGAALLLAVPQNWQMIAVALFLQGLCTQTVRSGAASFATNLFSRWNPDHKPPLPAAPTTDTPTPEKDKPASVLDVPDLVGSAHAFGGTNGSVASGGLRRQNPRMAGLVGALGVLYCWTSMGGVAGPVIGSFLYQYTATWLPFVIVAGCSLVLAVTIACFRLPRGGGYMLAQKQEEGREESIELGESKFGKLQEAQQEQEGPHSYRGLAKFDSLALHAEQTEVQRELGADKAEPGLGQGQGAVEHWSLRKIWAMVLRDRVGFSVLYIACIQSMAWGVYEVVVPYFLRQQCDFETSEIGVAFGVNNFTYAVTAFLAGSVVVKIGPSGSITGGALLLCGTLPLMVVRDLSCSFGVQYTLNGLNGIGFALIETPLLAHLTEIAGGYGLREYGLLVSVYQVAFSSGYAVAPFFSAALFSAFISVGVMVATVAWLLLGLCLWFWAHR